MTGFFYRQLAKAAMLEEVIPGQVIQLKVDLALAHDGSGPEILKLLRTGSHKVTDCIRVLVTLDHGFPAPTVKDRIFHREIHTFAGENKIHLYEHGEGVLHQVVPEQIVISLEGTLKSTVMARDVAMHIVNHCGHLLKGKALLLTGSIIDSLTISEKMSLCNFLPEGGVATALVLPQGEQESIDVEVSGEEITPMLTVPGSPFLMGRPAAYSSEKITVALSAVNGVITEPS